MRGTDDYSIVRDEQLLALLAADRLVEFAREAVEARGRFVLVLTGGTSPLRLYKLLAAEPYRSRIAWEKTYLFWGDERAVPQDDPRSNYGAAHEALVKYLPIPRDQVFAIDGAAKDLDAEAKRYAGALWTVVDYPPVVDVLMLGLGHDGHILSLYPGCPEIERPTGAVVALKDPPMNPAVSRVTMTSQVLCKARRVVLLAAGAAKAEAVRRVYSSPETMATLPARLLEYCDGVVSAYLDLAAAKHVSPYATAEEPAQEPAATAAEGQAPAAATGGAELAAPRAEPAEDAAKGDASDR